MAKRATREAFGETLVELAERGGERLRGRRRPCRVDHNQQAQKAYPIVLSTWGIAEQDMIGVASGPPLTGLIPFTASLAVCLVLAAATTRSSGIPSATQPQREGVFPRMPASRWRGRRDGTRCSLRTLA